jgi:hypothetical protein
MVKENSTNIVSIAAKAKPWQGQGFASSLFADQKR